MQSEQGINALDLIPSEPLKATTFARAVAILQANYGTEYSPEKTAILFDMVREDNWSERRFQDTFQWFLKNKKFPSWTISDWFDFGIKVYPRSWMLKKVKEGTDPQKDLEAYEIEPNLIVWKLRDGQELPFKKREDLCWR